VERKLAIIPLLLLAVLALAACGGGGSSGAASTTSSTLASPEGAWAKELTGVMTEFENKVSARLTEQISESSSQPLLEPLYATYSVDLFVLSKKLGKTEAPKACVALRKRMVDLTREVAALTEELGHQSHLSPEKYAVKVGRQGLKIDKIGHQLGQLTANPSC